VGIGDDEADELDDAPESDEDDALAGDEPAADEPQR
jgi:hypothetical protein